MTRWREAARNCDAVRYEIEEHSEISPVLHLTVGTRRFRRGLEVGIGPYGFGLLASHFADHVDRIDGLDPLPRLDLQLSDACLQACADVIRARVNYIQAQAESIPAETATYDIVSCINVVDHAQCPEAILHEICRVLKPDGLLVFAVSTLSVLGQIAWHIRRYRHPGAFLFVAHPHTFRWRSADLLVATVPGQTIWCDRPSALRRFAGHGRMSFWIRKKKTA